jgi:hypothetical protein
VTGAHDHLRGLEELRCSAPPVYNYTRSLRKVVAAIMLGNQFSKSALVAARR